MLCSFGFLEFFFLLLLFLFQALGLCGRHELCWEFKREVENQKYNCRWVEVDVT